MQMTKCYGYVRVSTTKQGDGASLDAQKDAITAFASQNGLAVTKWFEELETASKRGRPVFSQMMRELRAGKADGVIVHRWDRSTRNFSDWALISDLADDGVKVFCAGDNVDFGSRGGRLMADIQMVFAADYSRNLSIEVQKGQNQRLKQGYWPWRAPLGYVDNGEGELKTLCPKKAPLVKEAFERYLTGEYSITSLTQTMRERGLTGYYGRPLVRRNVEQILRTPFYCGQLKCRRGVFAGAHEKLITVANFQAVQRIKSQRHLKRETKHRFLYRGLFRCGGCGKTLTGERQKRHIYYRCHTRGCSQGSCNSKQLDADVERAVQRLQWSRDQIHDFREKLAETDRFEALEAKQTSLNMRAAEVQTRQSRLTDLVIDGTIVQADYKARQESLRLELARIDEERLELDQQKRQEGSLDDLLTFMSTIAAVYRESDHSQKRQLLRQLFSERTIKDGRCIFLKSDFIEEGRHKMPEATLPKCRDDGRRILTSDVGKR